MKKIHNWLIIAFICVLTAFIINRLLLYHPKQEVLIETKYDTIIIKDTIVIDKPFPLTEIKYKDRFIHDTVYIDKEPVLADIPIEEKIYSDERYTAVVSGFHPQLEKLELYNKDTIVNITTTETKIEYRNKYNRNAIGLNVGISTTLENGRLKYYPSISIGYNFDILRFKKK